MSRLAIILLSVWLAATESAASADVISGNSFVLRSTGSAAGTGWTLDRDGYLGTYITLAAAGNVTINVQAAGTASGGVNPVMSVAIADSQADFNVAPGVGNYSHTYSLPAGTFFVRTEMNNDVAATPRALTVNSMTVTGATIANQSTDANALAASDTYIANYRKGNAKVSIPGVVAGAQVKVSLKRIAFDFGAGVHGNIDQALGDAGTVEQTNYQKYLNQNFNTLVTAGPGYWSNTEPTQGNVDLHDASEVYAYAQAHGMHSRLHNEIWKYSQPGWINTLRTDAGNGVAGAKQNLTNAIAARHQYFVGSANHFDQIDVYNEAAGETSKDSYWSIYGASGVASIYNDARNAAAAAGYSPQLFVNNGNVVENTDYAAEYVQNLEQIRAAGRAAGYGEVVSGLGIEDYSTGVNQSPPAQFVAELQALNVSHIPSTLTEFGIFRSVSASDSATVMSQAMRLMFGNPNSTGFINWDWTLEDGGSSDQYAPNNGLYAVATTGDAAWSTFEITPAGKVWQDQLGIQDWDGNPNNGWNTQLTATADANGAISFNGYYGDYELTVGGKTYTFTLAKGKTQYAIPALAGDYNGNGVVDAADYAIWRDSLGSLTHLAADDNKNGIVDLADWYIWKTNFGSHAGAAAGAAGTVPELSCLDLAVSAACTLGLIKTITFLTASASL